MFTQEVPVGTRTVESWIRGYDGTRGETGGMITQQLVLEAVLSNVRVLRQELLRLCGGFGVDADAAGDLVLAVSEAFTNAIYHGTGASDALIEASVRISPQACEVSLHYPGEPFKAPAPQLPDDHATGGRGCYLMSVLVDRVEYRFYDGMTQVELQKSWA